MTYLLARHAPITDYVYFVLGHPEKFVEGLRAENKTSLVKRDVSVKTFTASDLEAAICSAELPASANWERFYLAMPTRSDWWAVFEITRSEPDVNSTPQLISRVTGFQVCSACAVRDLEPTSASPVLKYGGIRFDLFERGEYVRNVQSANSGTGGKWVFFQSGPPLGSENVKNYEKRSKKERFTVEDLDHLLSNSFGIHFLDESFYAPEAGCILIKEKRHY